MNPHIAPVDLAKSYRLINHGPTVLVSARHGGVDNVMAEVGITAHPDDVIVTTGSQMALDLVTRVFCDPGDVVLDECVAIPWCFLGWPALVAVVPAWVALLAGFALFRFFDIAKPWPVSWADRQLHGGFGAMLDDALAGLYALLSLQLVAFLF